MESSTFRGAIATPRGREDIEDVAGERQHLCARSPEGEPVRDGVLEVRDVLDETADRAPSVMARCKPPGGERVAEGRYTKSASKNPRGWKM